MCTKELFFFFFLMGDELGSATDIDRLLLVASSGPSTPIFTLIGNDDVLERS